MVTVAQAAGKDVTVTVIASGQTETPLGNKDNEGGKVVVVELRVEEVVNKDDEVVVVELLVGGDVDEVEESDEVLEDVGGIVEDEEVVLGAVELVEDDEELMRLMGLLMRLMRGGVDGNLLDLMFS